MGSFAVAIIFILMTIACLVRSTFLYGDACILSTCQSKKRLFVQIKNEEAC